MVPSHFIEANTEPISLTEIREKHLIPVFVKDNQPTISQVDFIGNAIDVVNGQELTMTFGGIKAYNLDNLNNYGGSMQHFRFFIGYKVKVCTNLCVWTDGYSGDLKVRNLQDLTNGIYEVVQNYHSVKHLGLLEQLPHYELSERQFAQMLGRALLDQVSSCSISPGTDRYLWKY